MTAASQTVLATSHEAGLPTEVHGSSRRRCPLHARHLQSMAGNVFIHPGQNLIGPSGKSREMCRSSEF
eukprot:3836977-Lingulodinium_polyedra.AAC.1